MPCRLHSHKPHVNKQSHFHSFLFFCPFFSSWIISIIKKCSICWIYYEKNIASNTLQLMDIHSWGKQPARSILLDKIRCVYSKRAHLMSKYNQRRLFEDSNSCSIFFYTLFHNWQFALFLYFTSFSSSSYWLCSLTRGAITMTLSGSFDTIFFFLLFSCASYEL